jgi:hypothetical protein
MDTALISALSALGGSVVGGLASGVTTWMGHRSQAMAGQRLHNLVQRETLYQDFVVAASQSYGNAVVSSDVDLERIVILHGMISRMRILSTPQVIECAQKTMDLIVDAYFLPNRSVTEIRELVRGGEMIDPLRAFSEVTRSELMQRQ